MTTPRDVITDVPGKSGRFWDSHTELIGPVNPPAWLSRVLGKRWAYNAIRVVAGLRLFARRHRARGVVTGGGASGLFFAWLQALVPFGRRPHVVVDCNWYLSGRRWSDWFKKLRIQLAARSVHRFVVWAHHEIEDYSQAFGIPAEQFVYVPFHDTLRGYDYEVRDDGYLFAGGNYDRDYPLLVEAVRSLEVPTWIATTLPEQLSGVEIPAHVRVEGTSVEAFRQAMAGARLVVIPMQADLLHSGGQQTLLNAMLLGKPTIAVGRKWASDFITDGVDGLIVEYGDTEGLRRAIRWVTEHPEEARQMGERARATAEPYTTQRTMEAIYQLATTQEAP